MKNNAEKQKRKVYLLSLTIDALVERLNREKVEIQQISKPITVERTCSNREWGDRDSGGYGAETVTETEYETEEVKVTVPDTETRLAALKDAVDLYTILNSGGQDAVLKAENLKAVLTDCYHHAETAAIKNIAGKALGYSFLKRMIDLYLR